MVDVAPSILGADFTALGSELDEVAGADAVHLDVMDGQFVPNISFGPPVIESLRGRTALPFDVHLMVERPDEYVDQLADIGVQTIVVHAEACRHLHRTISAIQSRGIDAGVAINPATGIEAIEPVLRMVDRVLVMSVNPGFGGQAFIPEVLEKVRLLDDQFDGDISIDGGVGPENAMQCIEAGADVLVSGSAIFGSDRPAETITALQQDGKITQ